MSVEALLAERAGYEMRGLKNRVAQVDAQLRALGYEVGPASDETPEAPARSERAVIRSSSGRRR